MHFKEGVTDHATLCLHMRQLPCVLLCLHLLLWVCTRHLLLQTRLLSPLGCGMPLKMFVLAQ